MAGDPYSAALALWRHGLLWPPSFSRCHELAPNKRTKCAGSPRLDCPEACKSLYYNHLIQISCLQIFTSREQAPLLHAVQANFQPILPEEWLSLKDQRRHSPMSGVGKRTMIV